MIQGVRIGPYGMEPSPANQQQERLTRIYRLIKGRGMSFRAATITVESAMFGTFCEEGRVRQEIENEKNGRSRN